MHPSQSLDHRILLLFKMVYDTRMIKDSAKTSEAEAAVTLRNRKRLITLKTVVEKFSLCP